MKTYQVPENKGFIGPNGKLDRSKKSALRTKEGEWVVYFEEVQWLAHYETDFVTALKYVWDNFLMSALLPTTTALT